MNKFENVDVIASLQAVMKQNTTHYQSDFQYAADLFRAAAKSADSMETLPFWSLPLLEGSESVPFNFVNAKLT